MSTESNTVSDDLTANLSFNVPPSPSGELLTDDLASVDTSFPLIASGTKVQVRIEEAKVLDNASKSLSLKMVTLAPTKSSKGDQLEPGVGLFERSNCVPTGKATPDMIVRGIGAIVQCFSLGSLKNYGGKPIEQCANVAQWATLLQGRTGIVDIGIEPTSTNAATGKSYPEKNVVTKWNKA